MRRRFLVPAIVALAAAVLFAAGAPAFGTSGAVTVTLVRWPYT
jgi:hypothetical protein